jgi:Ser/Thr protein kinase RdoA (MazF antagonist)
MNTPHPAVYCQLTPDLILAAVESFGLPTNASLLALNSYENRVYQVGVEDQRPVIAKFYRPHRWSDESIQEEHQFALELQDLDIPVVAPILHPEGHTLCRIGDYRFALYPSQGGRWPELNHADDRIQLGRLIGRIHRAGSVRNFLHRPHLDVTRFGYDALTFLLECGLVPDENLQPLEMAALSLLKEIESRFDCFKIPPIRIHGDCHPGNILWTESGAHFVDLDDTLMGPPIQDLWMLLDGNYLDMRHQLDQFLEGYTQFFHFDYSQTSLIEPLRGLRLIHYCAWLARRWEDPAFPANFPWFNTSRYWQEQLITLREQLEKIMDPYGQSG